MPKEVWLKLLTKLLWSKKFRKLPDNDHRMAYIGHMILEKLGLEDDDHKMIASTLFLDLHRYEEVRENLIECGLMDEAGKVVGFSDSQRSPDAMRQARYRERLKALGLEDGNATEDVTGDATNPPDSREQRVESRRRPSRAKREYSVAVQEASEAVVERINSKFGTQRTANETVKKAVRGLIEAGYDQSQIVLVVEHRLNNEDWFNPQKWGAESLIRLSSFPGCLERAQDVPRAPKSPSPYIAY